ncbi:MAG: hypothetical protein WD740_07840 [Anaerolineales bacterium]
MSKNRDGSQPLVKGWKGHFFNIWIGQALSLLGSESGRPETAAQAALSAD